VKLAADARDFLRDPIGRFVAGPRFFRFCVVSDLWGYVIWGDLDERDLQLLAASVIAEVEDAIVPHRSFVDLRRLRSVDASGYGILRAVIDEHHEHLARRITNMVVVRPDNLVGAVLEGIKSLVTFPHPLAVVTRADEALEQLGVTDTSLLDELEETRASLVPAQGIVAELRSVLDGHPPSLALPAAAQIMGLSPRSLQRKLQSLGTSFQAEHNLAQVRLAQRLIAETDATLSQIALDVGCGSLQHFSALFRRVTGQTPSQWRAQERAARK
jgi:AraC-like DNA-binding protein